MTRGQRVGRVANWVMLVVAFIAIGIDYLRLDSNQSAIKALSDRRDHDNCVTLRRALKPLRETIVLATQQVDTAGLNDERKAYVDELNVQRAAARAKFLGLIPDLHCG